jgi:hypothetical protein
MSANLSAPVQAFYDANLDAIEAWIADQTHRCSEIAISVGCCNWCESVMSEYDAAHDEESAIETFDWVHGVAIAFGEDARAEAFRVAEGLSLRWDDHTEIPF